MSKTNIAAIIAGLFVVSLIGFNVFVADGSEDNPVTTSIRDGQTEVTTKAEAEAAVEDAANTSTPSEDATETQTITQGVYTDYSEAEFASANERDDRVVLYFSADWCPTCQSLKRNLNASIIPDGLSILELDYDTETAFKQKHGVTFQHTLVEIDANGDTVKKWAGSPNIDAIISEL